MKQRTILFCVSLVVIVLGLSASEKGPVAVSPGSDVGIAVVGISCPTFSWTAVEWATCYRITVFEVATVEVMSYEQMAAMAYPVLSNEIQGRALSWTPSSDEQLSNGGMYVWYVQAMDAYGTAEWSAGRSFRVEVDDRLGAVLDKVTDTLKEHGVSDEIIGEVLKDMSSEAEKISISSGYNTTDKINIQGLEANNNTFYGFNAGFTITDLGGTGTNNTFIGGYAGYSNSTGGANTFIGQLAGRNTTTGLANTFLGSSAGLTNTTGDENTFLGNNAGRYNDTGHNNVFLGKSAGFYNSTGNFNTIIGAWAGFQNYEGHHNTFLGFDAGGQNISHDNTFIGYRSGWNNTEGDNNTFVGKSAGYSNDTGMSNTFIGEEAGRANTEGFQNTFIGQGAGRLNTTGNRNTFIGQIAGYSNDMGHDNTFIGQEAGHNNETGAYNTFIGNAAGYHNIGNGNTFIGNGAGVNNETGEGNIFLGKNAGSNETGSKKLYIDSDGTSSPLIYGDFVFDIVAINGRLGVGKKFPLYNLEVETTGENAVFALDRTDGAKTVLASRSNMGALGTLTNHPMLFAVNAGWKMRLNTDNSLSMSNGATCTAGGVWQDASSRAYKENIKDLTVDEAESTLFSLNPVKYNYKKDKEDEHLGFIAEDVPELVASKDRKGMSPMDVVAVLTKVVQEQHATLKDQQDTISELQERIAKLEKKSQ